MLLLSVCLLAGSGWAAEPLLLVQDAWIREAPPGASVLAGYLQLENPGTEPVIVNAINSRDFERIELHRTVLEQGLARMLPVERLEIAPGERVSLEPGGMHLMLFNPVRSLRRDDRVVFGMELDNGSTQSFEATLRRAGEADGHEHHHHH